MSIPSPLINVMVDAAHKASKRLVRDFGEVENLQVAVKAPKDFVTNADRAAEDTIYQTLLEARPHYGFLMEEQGEVVGKDTSNRWIIDPLDGTMNFLHGMPLFCISIALERDGELIAGVVHEPLYNHTYWTEKGRGAWLNRQRLRVSGRTRVEESALCVTFPNYTQAEDGATGEEAVWQHIRQLRQESGALRAIGSTALALAWVAAGKIDGLAQAGAHAWDVAAGIVLVREAGGFVTDFKGGKNMVAHRTIVAANDALHSHVLKHVRI